MFIIEAFFNHTTANHTRTRCSQPAASSPFFLQTSRYSWRPSEYRWLLDFLLLKSSIPSQGKEGMDVHSWIIWMPGFHGQRGAFRQKRQPARPCRWFMSHRKLVIQIWMAYILLIQKNWLPSSAACGRLEAGDRAISRCAIGAVVQNQLVIWKIDESFEHLYAASS